MRVVAIIQARLGSTRLPGKVMKWLGPATVLGHVIDRVSRCPLVDEVVVATPDREIALEAAAYGADTFIGSEHDVLERYYYAASSWFADVVVRITADCPLIDPDVIGLVISKYRALDVDYASNTIVRTYPQGLDVEVFSFAALDRAWKEATLPAHREHVTPYMHTMNVGVVLGQNDNSGYRLTLDTEDDWKLFEAIDREIGMDASTHDVLRLLDARPDIRALNSHVEQRC